MELGKVLEPLADFRQKMLFIRGLYNPEALKGNIHSSQTGNLLSGAPLASGGEIRSGTSIDQLLAQRYGRETKVPSLVLGCEKSNPSVHKNYSMLYSSHISWTSPTSPTPLPKASLIVGIDQAGSGDLQGPRRRDRLSRRNDVQGPRHIGPVLLAVLPGRPLVKTGQERPVLDRVFQLGDEFGRRIGQRGVGCGRARLLAGTGRGDRGIFVRRRRLPARCRPSFANAWLVRSPAP